MSLVDSHPQHNHPGDGPEVFAIRTLAERKALADVDPDGESEAIARLAPVAVRIAAEQRSLAEQVERINRISSRLAASAGRIDAADLLELDLPPLRWIVPDLIPEGTTILAAPPKVGKSCICYQLAVETAIGGELFGRRVSPGSALYLALEDGQRRGQTRLLAALAGRTLPHGRLDVQWSAPKIGAGLEHEITRWLDGHPDATLVAVDTLGKVRQPTNGKRGAYEVDVEDLGRLQELFRNRSAALVIVHHARKEAGDDFLASVSGTYGITGSADTIVTIRRPRLERFGTLLVTGRDVPDAEIPVRFDGHTWTAAPSSLDEASFERREVFAVIERAGPVFAAAIASATGLERSSVQHMVGKLVEAGAVARTTGGYVVVEPARAYISPITPITGGVNRVNGGIEGYGPGAIDLDPEPAP